MERFQNQKWLKIAGLSLAGLVLVGGLIVAGYKLRQGEAQPILQPTLIPTPKAIDTPFPQVTKEEKELKISAENNGSQVIIKVGQVLVLSLGSNPATGYGWEIAEIDETILKQIYHAYKSDRPLPGSSGQEIWHFHAQMEGRTTLTLNYGRPWEKMEPAFNVEVVVQGNLNPGYE